ncbi:DUF1611 domain-containing protein [Lyngbya confervoides]|uniref:NAD-dependent epimerase/dehydratase family protein n=1 Tax=Lyngbya confervoides BDU141951 TaxID=1574623 RepID=A0ABD4T4A1_9CYAN|nr:DUF1611 domain-containing protein [Lyngbya confervoides]MCM1983646.1 NAD-dependent epimerase/dehydratase family protein [Lyngbya confervoides BDU141951]
MTNRYFYSTLTRISDLEKQGFEVQPIPRDQWATGDYVVGIVQISQGQLGQVELSQGRMAHVMNGDRIVGAFGVRQATLEVVGDWRAIEAGGQMQDMTFAGIFGRITSQSSYAPAMTPLQYEGHVLRRQQKVCMQDFVMAGDRLPLRCPVILIVGTSMSAGKTTVARVIIHQLKQLGLKVVGTKLTGVGRYRDILAMGDAGADAIYDFVDVGLPSSICDADQYRGCLRRLLSLIAAQNPDVVVAEAGASPSEPYNGSVVLEEIQPQIKMSVLCASDPYAVLGVSQSFGFQPDLISGVTTSTSAGIELVEKLTHQRALRLPSPDALPVLKALLIRKLGLTQACALASP